MEDKQTDLADLSDTARRWVCFFHTETRIAAAVAIESGFIAAGKRPGLTPAVCDEIRKWAQSSERPRVQLVINK
jgi:hypothetical protein